MIIFKLLRESATMPKRGTAGSAGFDLYCTDPVFIHPHQRELVPTGVQIVIPKGYCGIIKDRSSIALLFGCYTHAGVIDADFEGEVKILMQAGSGAFSAEAKTRIAQIVFMPVLTECYEGDLFGQSIRGDGGFGSTGSN